MNHKEIRQKFLDFFSAKGGPASGGGRPWHKIVPSASLVPENDSSVLFTTAGMQQFKPYYLGAKDAKADFGSLNTASIQKCVRTSDIDEVGDESHLTFFEMLGNFSFGGYWKEEAIKLAYEFITKEMGLKIDYVSVFKGDEQTPADDESREIWQKLDPSLRIVEGERGDNFWGPTGNEGPCGPTTEIYVNDLEIWNLVFNEFYCDTEGNYKPLETKGVDTGMGLERLAMVAQGKSNIFETDLFVPILEKIGEGEERDKRILTDHVRSIVFMLSDGVRPSNTEAGYVLRRLIRRVTKENESQVGLAEFVIKVYGDIYPGLLENKEGVLKEIEDEEERFRKTLTEGLKQFEKGVDAFTLYTTYGFPIDLTKELARKLGKEIDEAEFEKKFKKHQELSRTSAAGKFKGGLAGTSEMETKYHTATHLLNAALRKVLGEHVEQKGSNITPERLRFDFSHPQKLTDEEIKKVEDLVNEKIGDDLPVTFEEVSLDEAKEIGAMGVFGEKYGERVKVYKVGDFSMEICGGPHVERTGVLGKFKIKKEESSSQGVRRIKAVLE